MVDYLVTAMDCDLDAAMDGDLVASSSGLFCCGVFTVLVQGLEGFGGHGSSQNVKSQRVC